MRTRTKICSAFGLLALLLMAAALVVPWKQLAERELKNALAAEGLEGLSFTLEHIGLDGLTLADVTLDGEQPLAIDRVTIDYSLEELVRRNIRQLKNDTLSLSVGGVDIVLHDAVIAFHPPVDGVRKGSWSVAAVTVQKAPLILPALAGQGEWSLENGEVSLDGALQSDDGTHHLRFSADPRRLSVHRAALPWNGGTLSTKDAVFPFDSKENSRVNLQVKGISLDALMAEFTNGQARAQGALSGTLPVIIGGKSGLLVRAGRLEADGPGTVTVSAGVLASDNPQLAILRDVLSDFRYDRLVMTLNSGEDGRLSARLSIGGHNPNFQGGRTVNLNVNLTGDVLSLVQQSVFPLTDPSQLLKQEQD